MIRVYFVQYINKEFIDNNMNNSIIENHHGSLAIYFCPKSWFAYF